MPAAIVGCDDIEASGFEHENTTCETIMLVKRRRKSNPISRIAVAFVTFGLFSPFNSCMDPQRFSGWPHPTRCMSDESAVAVKRSSAWYVPRQAEG